MEAGKLFLPVSLCLRAARHDHPSWWWPRNDGRRHRTASEGCAVAVALWFFCCTAVSGAYPMRARRIAGSAVSAKGCSLATVHAGNPERQK